MTDRYRNQSEETSAIAERSRRSPNRSHLVYKQGLVAEVTWLFGDDRGHVYAGARRDRRRFAVQLDLAVNGGDLGTQTDPQHDHQTRDGTCDRTLRIGPRYEHAQGEQSQGHAAHHAVERQGDLRGEKRGGWDAVLETLETRDLPATIKKAFG